MMKELAITFLSLLVFFLLVFAGRIGGMFFGVQQVSHNKQVMTRNCLQVKNVVEKSRNGWEIDW